MERIMLKELCNQIEKRMSEMGYNQDSIKRYRPGWKKLQEHLPDEYYDERLAAQFLQEQCKYELADSRVKFSKSQMLFTRSIRILSEFNRYGIFTKDCRKSPPIIWQPHFRDVVEAYLTEVKKSRFSDGWVKNKERELRYFLSFLDKQEINDVSKILPEHISGYIVSQSGYSDTHMMAKLTHLRQFLEFLYLEKYIDKKLSPCLPKARCFTRKHLPAVWSKEDIDKIMSAIDRGNPAGKRNYAIILIAARLGLRASDIRTLRLQDLKWERKTIEIVQEKTKQPLVLPLLSDVGWAIIDYLKNGRPITESEFVFVRHLAPFEAFANSSALRSILTRIISKAGIEVPPHKIGTHTLRNSLATELLQHDIPHNDIAGILGHIKTETTRHYLRIDLNNLRRCALEVEVNINE